MNKELYLPTIGIVLLGLGLYWTGMALQTYVLFKPVEGTIRDIDDRNVITSGRRNRTRSIAVTISYKVDGKDVVTLKTYPEDSPPISNTKVNLRYNPSKPTQVRFDNPQFDFGVGLGGLAVGSILCFLAYRNFFPRNNFGPADANSQQPLQGTKDSTGI